MSKKFKQDNKKVAREKINEYFNLADDIFSKDKAKANDYIRKSRRIAMKHKLRLGKLKRKFCKYCYSYLRAGINSRVRTREGRLIIYCNECKRYTRLPYK